MAAFLVPVLRYFIEYWMEMTDGISVPLVNVLCPTCEGEGTTALHGYDVTEMIREDPDFGDDYFRGHYDTTCDECRGNKVIKEFDSSSASPEMVKEYESYMASYYDDLAVQAAERAAGC